MNESRRAILREALRMLTKLISMIDGVCSKEQDAVDNCPENLQNTDRYEAMELAAENLADAMEKMEEAKEHIESAIK